MIIIYKTVQKQTKITLASYTVESSGSLSYLTKIYINTLQSRQKGDIFIAYYLIKLLLQLLRKKRKSG